MAFMVPVMKSQWALPEAKNTSTTAAAAGGGGGGGGSNSRRPQRRASLPSLGEAARLRSRSRTRKISESAKSDLAVYATGPGLISKPSFGRFNANPSSSGAGKKTRSVPANIVQFAGVNSLSSQSSVLANSGRKMSRAYTTATATATPTSPFAAAVAVRRRFSAALDIDTPDKARNIAKKSPPPPTPPSTSQPDKQSKTLSRRLLDKLRKSWKRSSSSAVAAAAAATTKPSMATTSSTSLLSLSSSTTSTTTTPSPTDK